MTAILHFNFGWCTALCTLIYVHILWNYFEMINVNRQPQNAREQASEQTHIVPTLSSCAHCHTKINRQMMNVNWETLGGLVAFLDNLIFFFRKNFGKAYFGTLNLSTIKRPHFKNFQFHKVNSKAVKICQNLSQKLSKYQKLSEIKKKILKTVQFFSKNLKTSLKNSQISLRNCQNLFQELSKAFLESAKISLWKIQNLSHTRN